MPDNIDPRAADRIADNLKRVRERIAAAAASAGRAAEDVRLIAVTKSAPVWAIEVLLKLGQRDLGENRVQQLAARAAQAAGDRAEPAGPPVWHMIGHLQRNKVRQLLPVCRFIHSLDSVRLADEIHKEAAAASAAVDVLIELNLSGEAAKSGASPDEAEALIEHVRRLQWLRVRGLMTMAPLEGGPAAARPVFAALRETAGRMRGAGMLPGEAVELSMGMSQDFEDAIREGATMVRIGSTLFEGVG